jgi:hypothetical protein
MTGIAPGCRAAAIGLWQGYTATIVWRWGRRFSVE